MRLQAVHGIIDVKIMRICANQSSYEVENSENINEVAVLMRPVAIPGVLWAMGFLVAPGYPVATLEPDYDLVKEWTERSR